MRVVSERFRYLDHVSSCRPFVHQGTRGVSGRILLGEEYSNKGVGECLGCVAAAFSLRGRMWVVGAHCHYTRVDSHAFQVAPVVDTLYGGAYRGQLPFRCQWVNGFFVAGERVGVGVG